MQSTKLAEFKAKYGISHHMASSLFNAKLDEIRTWTKTGSPKKIDREITKLERLIDHLIKEGEILKHQAPMIQVLQHELEMKAKSLAEHKIELQTLNSKLDRIEKMGFLSRIKFLFTAKL